MRIAVIGAGLAGLHCAHQLTKLDYDVTVFEKSRGCGGRMAVKRLDWGELDLGAQYFTARSPEFRAELAKWLKLGIVRQWRFTPYQVTNQGLVPSPDTDTNAEDHSTARYVGSPCMNSPVKYLASTVNLQLNTCVTNLEYTNNRWRLTGDNNLALGSYDWVIVATPGEQASALLNQQTHISYLIAKQVHTPCWALGVATTGKVAPSIQGVFGDNTVSWLSRLSSKPERCIKHNFDDIWMLHFSPETSTALTADTVLPQGQQWLDKVFNNQLTIHHHYQHFWRYANLVNDTSLPPLIDDSRRVVVIGDWTQGGRIEGAFLSAQRVINYMFA
ncbi:FAD-dependent oxidoreductase [Saccharobesus litoralis]|uniref:FAD-dependent oxidoreductase n=1 Tax=Saccharobesus litoralis TaxID=2172099 RepID=A0A2S0VWL4_9ALTE|nr:FAD-dependent oxidoreductase [Saccharobesus litoralis]AWB68490.1 FAD-dependent oxidoreductase [Saccharobesus litoralis]